MQVFDDAQLRNNKMTMPPQRSLIDLLKQLGVAALYALLLYIGVLFFDGDKIVGHFEPASGLALAVLLIGGKRYAWGVLLGAALIHAIAGDPLWEAVIVDSGDTLQAFCGAWLLTRDGKFDLRLQSLRDYLWLILLGGCASIAIGALVVNTALLVSGLLAPANYFYSLARWWMSDTLGVILIAPLIMLWWEPGNNRREAGRMAEAVLLLGLTILVGQAVFLGWWHDVIGQVAKGYWLFLITTWVAVRHGNRETVIVLIMTAIYALLGAIHGIGIFADDIAQTHLVNYWLFMVTLSIVGMALATHFTERKQAEELLRESEQRFRQLAENICEVFWMTDPAKNKMLYISPAYEQVWGRTLQSLYNSPQAWLKAIHGEDRQRVLQAALTRQAVGLYDEEYRIVRPNGDVRWIHDRAFPVHDSGGAVYRIAGVAEDITERKKTELALKQYKIVIDTVNDGFWITDAMGNMLEANAAYAKMSGYSVDELVNIHVSQLEAIERSVEEVGAHIEKIIARGYERFETRHRHKDGHEIDVEVSVSFMPELQQFFVFIHDITDRKQAEEQIKTLAFYDTLTQLPNRRLLDDRLRQVIALSKRNGCYSAVMFLDLDNFKTLNDTHGHGVGDLLLIEAAQRLTYCVREVDTVARFGGDEFVVVLSDLSKDKVESASRASIIAEKIRAALAEPYVLKIQYEGEAETIVEHHSAASIGVVLFINHETSTENLLKYADTAMYQAKKAGRNQVRFYESKA